MADMIAILGAGGHGADLAEIAGAGGQLSYFLDDGVAGYKRCEKLRPDEPYVVGVNDPATRRRLAVGASPVTLVHPTATVAPSAHLAPGCVVGAGTHIGPSTILAEHVHIGDGCTITRTEVGAFTTISPGVNIAGDCSIGDECLIGVGASIANLRTIGDRVIVGAGAVVVHDVEDDTTVAGVPARPIIHRHTERVPMRWGTDTQLLQRKEQQ